MNNTPYRLDTDEANCYDLPSGKVVVCSQKKDGHIIAGHVFLLNGKAVLALEVQKNFRAGVFGDPPDIMGIRYESVKFMNDPQPDQWHAGQPDDKSGAFAVIFNTNDNGIIWDGTVYPHWSHVIAWTRVPRQPKVIAGPLVSDDDCSPQSFSYEPQPSQA